jgi:glycosyltransferase involved in cell wall biosynthesis
MDLETWRQGAHPPGIAWFDSLYLDALHTLPGGDICCLVVHHLPSLHPPAGMSGADLFGQYEKPILDRMDALLVTSEWLARWLAAQDLAAPILCVPPAPVQPLISPRRTSLHLRAFMAANLIPRKGILPLIQAIQTQAASFKDLVWSLTIAGDKTLDAEYAAECQAYISMHSSLQEHIHLLGPLSQDEVQAEMARANLYVSAAEMETFGMSMQDAVAAGLPVLALARGSYASHVLPDEPQCVADTHAELAIRLLYWARHPEALTPLLTRAAAWNPWAGYDWPAAAHHLLAQAAQCRIC